MNELRKAAEMALEALEGDSLPFQLGARAALRQALAQPEQEPVATVVKRQYEDGTYAGNALDWTGRNSEDDFPVGTKLYTAPPKREWVGLTEEVIKQLADMHLECVQEYIGTGDYISYVEGETDFAKAIEAKLKEKNT